MTIRASTYRCIPLALATLGVLAPVIRGQTAQQEIEDLLAHPAVTQAMGHVVDTDEETMRDLLELTQIPAPPFMEEVRGRRFAEMLAEIGIDSVYTDDVGNVIGVRRGQDPDAGVLALTGHLDTVFPEGTDVTVRIDGDTLRAPGIADDTRGLAAVLATLRAMNAAEIRTEQDVLFIGTVGEEGLGDLRGVKHLFRDGGPRIDAFISIDGTSSHNMTTMGLGSHRYRVTFKGPGGHSWGAFGLANPAHAMGRAMHYFDELGDAHTSSGPRTSYNVGRIGGGTSVNSVPFESWMEIDMRSESVESLDSIDVLLHVAVERALLEENAERRRGEELTVDLDMIGNRPSGEGRNDMPLIQRAIAVSEAMDRKADTSRGSTDSNIPISKGIPAITIGGGGIGAHTHSLDEYFINEEGYIGIQRALLIVLAQAGVVTPIS